MNRVLSAGWLAHPLILKMEARSSSEKLGKTYQTTRGALYRILYCSKSSLWGHIQLQN